MDFSIQLLPEQPLAELIDVRVERIRTEVLPHGYNHMALGLVDPYLVESWSGQRISGLPDLASQLELFAAQVVPAFADGS
jgi:hypothetical protein